MKLKTKIISLLTLPLLFLPLFTQAQTPSTPPTTQNEIPTVQLYGSDDCPHCQDAKAFLQGLQNQQQIIFHYQNIADIQAKQLFLELAKEHKLPKTVPLIHLSDTNQVYQGFDKAETSGKEILKLLNGEKISESTKAETCPIENSCTTSIDKVVRIPFFGEVNLETLSLTSSSLVLGFIDGFNPCAMWVLVMFLTALIQVGDKKKMFQIVGIFIMAEAIMYYLILNTWMYAWDFVGLDKVVTPIVGFIAVGAGIYFLYDRYKNKQGACQVGSLEQKSKTSNKIKALANKPMTRAVFFAVLGLALSVNIIEFACSVGIPQTFTKILDLNFITGLTKHYYILLYTFMYMIDDFIVFAIALWSFGKLGLTNKYARWSHLIGGLLMAILGAILIIKPALLVF